MKIALVFDGLGWGGIARVGVDYAKMFLEMGHKVDIYNLKPQYMNSEKNFPKNCRIIHKKLPLILLPDIYMFAVKYWSFGRYIYPLAIMGKIGSRILLHLYRIFQRKQESYDIAIAFAGHYRDLTFVAYEFISSQKKMCWWHEAPFRISRGCYGNLYRKIKNLCILQENGKEYIQKENSYASELNIQHIYNPISLEKGELDEELIFKLRRAYGDFLLMVGRFGKDKDQKTVIEALKILHDKYRKRNYLVFVGTGSTLDKCKVFAKKLGIDEYIFFAGAREDVQNFYSAAQLSIHSSPAEGLPTVLLEAMKYGTPIVATDSPIGVTEILKDDVYGLRCAVANPEDMASKINIMLEDKELQFHYISQGKMRVQEFSYEKTKKRLKTIIMNLK